MLLEDLLGVVEEFVNAVLGALNGFFAALGLDLVLDPIDL